MIIKCGNFSYAEIPRNYKYIMGVSGTLKTLSEPERDVIEKEYQILRKTFSPSVFGKNNLDFVENRDLKIEADANYYNAITREIETRRTGRLPDTYRAVIVVFESAEAL
jgi:hypothetical protein